MKYVVVSEKKWNSDIVKKLSIASRHDWIFINEKEGFTFEAIKRINPAKIFLPHWSYYIPEAVYSKYECIVFHMTDLPFGRGGSPLQNLIVRSIYRTKISAVKVEKELDAGPIYLKDELELYGSAEEIFMRANDVISKMILTILDSNLKPVDQIGTPTQFKRRTPEESSINSLDDIVRIYDHIRMLDAEGYPQAYLEINGIKFEFSHAQLKADNSIIADVKISKK